MRGNKPLRSSLDRTPEQRPGRATPPYLRASVPSCLRLRPAFTIIELLVVISIIILLISMLLPAMNWARHQSRRMGCQSNLRQTGAGLNAHTVDLAGDLPGPSWYGQTARYKNGSKTLAQWLAPYMGLPDATSQWQVNPMFICPSVGRVQPGEFTIPELVLYGALSEPNPTTGKRVFGYPAFNGNAEYGPSKFEVIVNPSQAAAVRDIDYPLNYTAGWWDRTTWKPAHGLANNIAERNYLFFDAHVEGRSEEQEFIEKPPVGG